MSASFSRLHSSPWRGRSLSKNRTRVSSLTLLGIAALIVALAIAFFFERQARREQSTDNPDHARRAIHF